MDKYLSDIEMIRFLEESLFLYAGGYGKGIPVYSKKGLDVISNMVNLFKKSIEQEGVLVSELINGKLIDRNEFIKAYQHINTYSEEIIEYDGMLVTPDVLANSFEYLKNNMIKNESKSVFSSSSFYRDNKTNNLIPLYKDRNIYPVIQIDQIICNKDYQKNIHTLKNIFKKFYNSIGIQVAFLETSEAPTYAKYELYIISHDKSSYTKLAIVYVLSDQFKENFKIIGDVELFDSGFSGKALYKSLQLTSEYAGSFSIHPTTYRLQSSNI
jgi:hypothetical protein